MSSSNVEMLEITPEIALKMLSNNPKNRPVSDTHVRFLARQMHRDEWKLNGSTIVLDGDRLIDGQHRLQACITSKTPFRTLVVRGVSAEAFDTIDTGKRRKASDVLGIHGEKNASILAASLRFIERYNKGTLLKTILPMSNVDIENCLEKYPGTRASVDFILHIRRLSKENLTSPSSAAALHFLCSQKDFDLSHKFFTEFIRGINLEEKSPAFRLRSTLVKAKIDPRRPLTQIYKDALIVIAWNNVRRGMAPKLLKWHISSKFPEIV